MEIKEAAESARPASLSLPRCRLTGVVFDGNHRPDLPGSRRPTGLSAVALDR